MKNSIFALALVGLIAASCGTSSQYASSAFDDAIYSGPEKTIVISSATDTRLQDLKERTAQTSTIIVNGKEAQVIYMDDNNTVDLPINIDEENTYLVIDESISYEELLRKFDSPDYTINLHIESRYDDWDYYRPWMWGYNPWSWRYYSRFQRPWSYYAYSPYYWRDPFFYNYYYSYGSYYDPWGPYWYSGGYYPYYNYGYSSGYYYNNRPYKYGEVNPTRGRVSGKRVTEGNRNGNLDRSDRRDRSVITSIPRQNSTVGRSAVRGEQQERTSTVSNSVYRRGNTSTMETITQQGSNTTRRSTYNTGTSRTQNPVQRQSTGTYRRSTTNVNNSSQGARNSGNTYNSTQTRRESSTTGTTRSSSSYTRTRSESSSASTRSSNNSSSSATRSTSSSSSSAGRSSSSSSSSNSGYRR
jgi:hypothetical protein